MRQQVFVIDVESQGPGCGVEVGPVDEKGDPFEPLGLHAATLQNLVHTILLHDVC